MVTRTCATLTWLCIWLLEMSVEECVTTVSTTPWDATVRCVNLSTTKTLTGISETHGFVSVSCFVFDKMMLNKLSQLLSIHIFILNILRKSACLTFFQVRNVPEILGTTFTTSQFLSVSLQI